jgi:flavin-dependent dehydrogenase
LVEISIGASIMREVDLIIIGSGPAGVSTALHLLQRDQSWAQRMILLDKDAHPRHKLCGGGVTRIGLETLQGLGFDLPLPIPHEEVNEIRLLYRGREIRARGRPEFLVFNRIEFDVYLAKQVRRQGVIFQENEAVERLKFGSARVEVKTSHGVYQAKAVVGADGSKGITRRIVGRHNSGNKVARVLETIRQTDADRAHFQEHFAVFEFTPVDQGLQGYFWDFPSRVEGQPRFNRGVYDARFITENKRAKLSAILKSEINNLEDNVGEVVFQGHPIHLFSPRSRIAMPRLLLVGDAAGVDPLFGEGIGPALAYGKVAAGVIDEALKKDDFSFGNYKLRLLTSEIGRNLFYRWFLSWWIYRLSMRPVFMHALWTVGRFVVGLRPIGEPLYTVRNKDSNQASRRQDRKYSE